jgi:xylan 1,4-beta-xylosidase
VRGSGLDHTAAIRFSCDLRQSGVALPHFWEHTVGSCHATLALRADWQRQLEQAHRELGFCHVRFHGLLDDDMGTLVCELDQPVYSFFNADQIMDFLLSIGMKPFIELSFMPLMLSSGDAIVFHYRGNITPPKDYAAWGELVGRLVRHWVARYGVAEVRQWYFEVWNEPNLAAFFSGTQADYFELYRVSAAAIKAVDAQLRVGGPATAANAWITPFLEFCAQHRVPVDFVTTHHYPTDAFGQPGDDTEAQLAASRRSVLREQAREARREAGSKPLYYTEWSSSSNARDTLHDQPYAAAFVVKTVLEAQGLVQGYSYWTFSDIFEENYFPSVPFHGGFGLLSLHGIPKPTYRAFELLHECGTRLLPVEGTHDTVDCWVTREAGTVTVLLTNFALPRHPITAQTVRVTLAGSAAGATARIRRIDEVHANPRRHWVEMGSPEYLSKAQVAALVSASACEGTPLELVRGNDALNFELTLPPLSVASVRIELQP